MKELLKEIETILHQEILSLNEKSKNTFTYKFVEGKFKVGYNKRSKTYFVHLDGMAVEEMETSELLLESMLGYLPNQTETILIAIIKSSNLVKFKH